MFIFSEKEKYNKEERKNIMKRITACLICLVLTVGMLTACSTKEPVSNNEDGKLSIVCTIFPIYDWIREIAGSHSEEADITMLLDNGVDLHSFQPTADDLVKISDCDIFIYVGGESDEKWVDDALKIGSGENRTVINLMDALSKVVVEEEEVEGMQSSEEGEEEEETEYDEHIWLSLKNAVSACDVIEKAFEEKDEKNAADYKANFEAYTKKLSSLDSDYAKAVADGKNGTLIFADRFPFRYMFKDYGLKYYAAFSGCSAETEASFETITFLAGKLDELKLDNVITIEGSDGKFASTVIATTEAKDMKTLSLDSMQGITARDVQSGATYLSIMESNLQTLKTALG